MNILAMAGNYLNTQVLGAVVDQDVLHISSDIIDPQLLPLPSRLAEEERSHDGDQQQPWGDLIREVLPEILGRLPFEERLRTAPLVCKGWRNATFDPACWRSVDTDGWFKRREEADYWWEFECEPVMELVVKSVVDRSRGLLEELRARHCTDAAIDYIADRCPRLAVLSISSSLFVTDKSVTNLAAGCPRLKVLDVSDCYNISNQALEAVGRNCKSLGSLSRNMVNKDWEPNYRHVVHGLGLIPGGDEEAIVVSEYMVNLQHLEMKKTSLSNLGLAYLARGCSQLKSLNLACCTSLSGWALDKVSEKCPNIVDFTRPIAPRLHISSDTLNVPFGF